MPQMHGVLCAEQTVWHTPVCILNDRNDVVLHCCRYNTHLRYGSGKVKEMCYSTHFAAVIKVFSIHLEALVHGTRMNTGE